MIRPATLAALIVVAGLLASPRAAGGQEPPLPDAVPTWWHEAAGLTPLLTAPPPPNPATICLIDTGVTPTPDLDITARWAYDGGTLDDVHATPGNPGHGTLVAHFAAGAVNGWGGAGAFPHGRISSVRVFPREGGASWQDYIRAITRCLKLDANTKVIVISIGGQEIEPGEADELEAHIEQARNLYGANVVASAGNAGGRPDFPGRFPAVFTVAAVGLDRVLCRFSARGPEVDIAAPGCGLFQSGWSGAQWDLNGTSFAAPIVAGLIAALRSYSPDLTPNAAEELVTRSASGGVLNAASSLRAVGVEQGPALGSHAAQGPANVSAAPAAPPADRRAVSAVPRPLVTARRAPWGVVVSARNRPRGAAFELRARGRSIMRRRSSLRLRTRARSARCRFVVRSRGSRWTSVRW